MQCARALHIEPRNVTIKVHGLYSRQGAILAGDIKAACDSIRTKVSLESDEAPEKLAQLIRLAEASCFTIAALRNPTPVDLEVTLNGESLALDR